MESTNATPTPPSERLNAQELGPGYPVLSAGAEPWVRMDSELARAVLAKTEEELLGGLTALMRNKVELERTTCRLTRILEETSEAQRELERVCRQLREAEDELAVRQEEQVRLREQTAEAPDLRLKQEMPGVARDQPEPAVDPLQEELERLLAELEQLRATYFTFQVESNRSRESLEEEVGTLRQEVARRQTQAEAAPFSPLDEGGAAPEVDGKTPPAPLTGAAPSGEVTVGNTRQEHDALKRKLLRSSGYTTPAIEARD